MKQELFDGLKNKFPLSYAQLKSIDCEDGWFNIIKAASHSIEFELEWLPIDLKDQIHITTIKQKLGGIRLYLNHTTPRLDGIVMMLESISYTTCETCGNVGDQRNSKGYMYVSCEDHIIKRK
jgi:hypothetical protein